MSDLLVSDSENVITINQITNINLFEYADPFVIENKSPDEWQLICVYRGFVDIAVSGNSAPLTNSHMIIIQPNCSYSLKVTKNSNPLVLTISFRCTIQFPEILASRFILLSKKDFDTLNEIVIISDGALNSPNVSYQYYQFALGKNFSPSKYQLLKNKFEIFLLSFIDTSNEAESETVSPFQLLSKQKLIAEIDAFLLANINETITLKQISEKLNISTSYLSSLYKKSHPQKSIIQTFNELKINKAKQYLEQSDLNITQISDILGFSSVHYFSRIFKKTVGISPVQYVHSLHTKK